MGERKENPFRPGLGRVPPHLAGHKRARKDLERIVSYLIHGRGDMAMMRAPPGYGKRALLAGPAKEAMDKGAIVRVASAKGSEEEPYLLTRRLLVGNPEAGGEIPRDERNFDGGGDPEMRRLIGALVGDSPTLLVVEDTEFIGSRAGAEILSLGQHFVSREHPLAIVFSGTDGVGSAFRATRMSFWERCTRVLMSALEPEDAREALSVPAQDSGMPFDDDALDLLVGDARGYPLHIQMLGHAAWQAAADAGADRISLQAAKDGAGRAQADKDAFNEERRQVAAGLGALEEAETFAKAFVGLGDETEMREGAFDELIGPVASTKGRRSFDTSTLLVNAGMIETGPGYGWREAIPGICAHIAKKAQG